MFEAGHWNFMGTKTISAGILHPVCPLVFFPSFHFSFPFSMGMKASFILAKLRIK